MCIRDRLGIVQQLVESSNVGFVVDLEIPNSTADPDYAWAVYKPELGEQPLWDFPPGLYRRERAAFVLSNHLGWNLVPPTVIRHDGPAGVGSVQWLSLIHIWPQWAVTMMAPIFLITNPGTDSMHQLFLGCLQFHRVIC